MSSRHRYGTPSRDRYVTSFRHRDVTSSRNRYLTSSRYRYVTSFKHKYVMPSRHRYVFQPICVVMVKSNDFVGSYMYVMTIFMLLLHASITVHLYTYP